MPVTLPLHKVDVFASTIGGARVTEPASDLALAVAIASAHHVTPPPLGLVALGEIGLSGELRRIRDLPQRLAEAARLGFALAVVPAEAGVPGGSRAERKVDGMRVLDVPDVASALRVLGLLHRSSQSLELLHGGEYDE